MIAQLTGLVADKRAGAAVIDVAGVGYRVHLSEQTLSALPPRGQRVTLRTYTHVRDDAIHLYGFATEEEESVFQELIGVKNVGPKAAQNILSGIGARDLAEAVAAGDLARLTKVPGVGKKTAERLVLELKEKLAGLARGGPRNGVEEGGGALEQLEQALLGLGYRPQQAQGAVEKLKERAGEKKVDELLRDALKLLRG